MATKSNGRGGKLHEFSERIGIGKGPQRVIAAVLAVLALLAIVWTVGGLSPAQLDDYDDSCVTGVKKAQKASASVDADKQMEENAIKVWSVFKEKGLTDEEIAGMLGNLEAESSIDPTCIEGIYDEPCQIGSRKQQAIDDPNSYCTGYLFPEYAGHVSINQSVYHADDGNYWPGIGMAQMTPGYVLVKSAEDLGKDWSDITFQLAWMVAGDGIASKGPRGTGFFEEYASDCAGKSASECAIYFAKYYEGNTVMAQDKRAQCAEQWLSRMGSWAEDTQFAQSVLDLAKSMGAESKSVAVRKAKDNCEEAKDSYDNSDLANAALSYASDSTKDSEVQAPGGNAQAPCGTALYQKIAQYIVPSGAYYASCDRGVAYAVLWTGYDDDYPLGPTGTQVNYLLSSDASGGRWKLVGDAATLSESDLQPGDVFITKTGGHTFMYVGNDLVQKTHPNAPSGSNDVSASFGQHAPGCESNASYVLSHGGIDSSERAYYVFRCTNPQGSKKYAAAGD